jgi:hypothetical protein
MLGRRPDHVGGDLTIEYWALLNKASSAIRGRICECASALPVPEILDCTDRTRSKELRTRIAVQREGSISVLIIFIGGLFCTDSALAHSL